MKRYYNGIRLNQCCHVSFVLHSGESVEDDVGVLKKISDYAFTVYSTKNLEQKDISFVLILFEDVKFAYYCVSGKCLKKGKETGNDKGYVYVCAVEDRNNRVGSYVQKQARAVKNKQKAGAKKL
jgi:hypothetical protein